LLARIFCCFAGWIFQSSFSLGADLHPFLQDLPPDGGAAGSVEKAFLGGGLQARILIRDQIEVRQDRIVLEDVAACENSGAELVCEAVALIDLGAAPPAGRTIRLTKTGIADILHREWPTVALTISGAEVVVITAPAVDVDKLALQNALALTLAKISGDREGARIRIERLYVVAPVKIRPGVIRYEFPMLQSAREDILSRILRNNGGAITVDAELHSSEENGVPVQRVSVSVQLVVEKLVAVATSDINAGSLIAASDVKLDWVVLKMMGQRGFSSTAPLVGLRTKRSVFMGSPIDGAAVESVNIVSRGEIVGLTFKAADMEVMAKVEALSSGASGEVIEVLNRETKKKLRARVIARSQVEAL